MPLSCLQDESTGLVTEHSTGSSIGFTASLLLRLPFSLSLSVRLIRVPFSGGVCGTRERIRVPFSGGVCGTRERKRIGEPKRHRGFEQCSFDGLGDLFRVLDLLLLFLLLLFLLLDLLEERDELLEERDELLEE